MPKKSNPALVVESWPTNKPIPYARNPRKISEQAVASVAGSIKEFGFKSPIIVDAEGVIINGHTRQKAAMLLGLETVPVVIASDLTPAQVQAYRLADNRVAEFSEWDADLLKIELDECPIDLGFASFDILATTPPVPDFAPGTEDGQGQLDKIKPHLIKCPSCGCVHDARQAEAAK